MTQQQQQQQQLQDLLLERFGISAQEVLDVFDSLAPTPAPQPSLLPEADAALLDAAGFTEDPAAHARTSIRTATILAELVHTALSAGEVANLLSVTDSRVRQRRADRTLWAIQDHGRWLYPRMQFRLRGPDHGQIPGLAQVLPALPADLSALSIAGFLTTAQPDLVAFMTPPHLAGPTLSLRESDLRATEYVPVQVPPLIWLDNGGAPEKVIVAASHSESWGTEVNLDATSAEQSVDAPPPLIRRSHVENTPASLGPARVRWSMLPAQAQPLAGYVVRDFNPLSDAPEIPPTRVDPQ